MLSDRTPAPASVTLASTWIHQASVNLALMPVQLAPAKDQTLVQAAEQTRFHPTEPAPAAPASTLTTVEFASPALSAVTPAADLQRPIA